MVIPRMQFIAALTLSLLIASLLVAETPDSIPPGEFEKLQRLIQPDVGESRWMEIDWYPSVWEARQKAAAEGKPLFLMAGSGGAPAAGC
jgi:hypothetical protein